MTAEPNDGERARALAQVDRDYPGWHAWPAALAGLLYARRPQTSPPMVVRATSVNQLRTEIENAETERGAAVSAAEDQAAALRAKYGERWKIWYVPLALGGYTWCARIHGDDLRNVVHADTAEYLDEHIRLREEDLAADAALSDEAARDLDGDE
jgi:hypothetical protein